MMKGANKRIDQNSIELDDILSGLDQPGTQIIQQPAAKTAVNKQASQTTLAQKRQTHKETKEVIKV